MKLRFVLVAVLLGLVALVAAVGGGVLGPGAIAPIAVPDPSSFGRVVVERGEKLAGLGNCGVCHTRKGGAAYAGGVGLETPFGVITTTNITPDPIHGIGAWSEAAFIRAMREGVDRGGRHLYPAFPYDYFAKVTDEDLKAIYAYLMTRAPVAKAVVQTSLAFPFNIRPLLVGWKFLYHDTRGFVADPGKDKEWNRGAYLAEGLGHCGACHSPRNWFGAAAKSGATAFSGGHVEGWYVPPLNGTSPGMIGWTQKSLVNYLIDGWDKNHGIAAGPMTPIVDGLKDQLEDDVFAIAAYVMSLKSDGKSQAEQEKLAADARFSAQKAEWNGLKAVPVYDDSIVSRGVGVFAKKCAYCHKSGGKPAPLALTTTVNAPDAGNLIRLVLFGIQPPRGALDRPMPGGSQEIDDKDLVALVHFVRKHFTTKPAWSGVGDLVRKIRVGGNQ